MRASLYLLVVGVALASARPQDQRFFGTPGIVNPGFLGGVHPNPGFIQPGIIQPGFLGGVHPNPGFGFQQPGFGFQQPIQFNQAGQPCEKFSKIPGTGQYTCTETLQQIAPGQFEVGGSQFGGGFGGGFGGHQFGR